MFDPKSRFQFDHWYKFVAALGAAGVAGAATVDLHGIANAHALLFSFGVLLIGVGEWVNHSVRTVLVPAQPRLPRGERLMGFARRNKPHGVLMDVAGAALIAVALYKLAHAA